MEDKFKKLTQKVVEFRDKRDWEQFHNPKDMAISLVLEASEVMEHFQWKNQEEMDRYIKTNKRDIADELSDVFWWVLLMAHDLDIDLGIALPRKLKETAKRYPVRKSKGRHTKHDKL
jgi:NTP pyrophosphatase (non-canonical NTP hydrolase)